MLRSQVLTANSANGHKMKKQVEDCAGALLFHATVYKTCSRTHFDSLRYSAAFVHSKNRLAAAATLSEVQCGTGKTTSNIFFERRVTLCYVKLAMQALRYRCRARNGVRAVCGPSADRAQAERRPRVFYHRSFQINQRSLCT